MTKNTNWKLISSFEGKGVKQGYVPSENSGVTIATGFDLKEKDAELLEEMGISAETTSLFSKFFGMSGAEAKEVAHTLNITDDQVTEIDNASHQWYEAQIKKAYENGEHKTAWDDLTEAQKTVIVSVGFQYGSGFKRKDGSEMNFIKQARANDWEALIANLRNFGDNFNTRRNKEADFLEAEKKTLDKQFKPIDITKQKYLWSELPDVSRGLFLDGAYNYSQLQEHIAEGRTVPAFLKASIRENTIFANAYDIFAAKTFIADEGFSWENNKEEFDAVIKEYNLSPEFAESLIGALNSEHLKYLAEKGARHQKNAELLASLGWKGTALQIATFILDPVNLTGYGALSKVMKGTQFLTGLTRRQHFLRSGLATSTMEGALYAPIVANNPTLGFNDLIIASALGGTLGGGISALTAKNLRNIATANQKIDLIENGLTPTKEAENTVFKNNKPTHKNKEFLKDLNDTYLVDTMDIFYPKLRSFPFLGITAWASRSGTLGTSLSKKAKLFNLRAMDDPIGYKDLKTGQAAKVDSTVEAVRDQIFQMAHSKVYPEVDAAMVNYLKSKGYGQFTGFFQFSLKTKFMHDTKRAMIALSRKEKKFKLSQAEEQLLKDVNIVRAANGYADGWQLWVKLLNEAGVEGAEDLAKNTGRYYVPQKLNYDSIEPMKKLIGEDGIEDLIVGGIRDQQPLIDRLDNPVSKGGVVKVKTGEISKKTGKEKTAKISVTKARALAQAILRAAKYNSRLGGLDLEQLIKIRNPEALREYIDDVFSNLDDHIRNQLFNDLNNHLDILTSGRFQERIRLNSNYETTIKGHKVRLDDIYENDVDMLWHSYTNEMSGWYSLADRLGIKSRNQWLKYRNEVVNDINASYSAPDPTKLKERKWGTERALGNKFIANEEIATVDSFFNNLMGRSTEVGDPSSGWNKLLRDLRRYNFVRVLNQVGVAQLPEFGVNLSNQGWKVMLNEIPAVRRIIEDAQQGKMTDTFRKDMSVIGVANGDEAFWRQFQAYDVLDRGISQLDTSKKSLIKKPVQNAAEKVTGHSSGLIAIDKWQRKIAMRSFVHNLVRDVIEAEKKGDIIQNIKKGRLNRYRVIGLGDDELIAFAKELKGKNIVWYKNALGYRVNNIDFVRFKDQELVRKFAIAVNRYTKRSVQFNMIGDTSRYFSDASLGKTFSQFRQFIMVAWNKQFLHNVAMGDFNTFAMFMYTTLIGGLAYVAQAHFNTIGMSPSEKKAYLKKKLGEKGDLHKIAMASFQRAGWSSVMPPLMDMGLGLAGQNEYRFNTRSSGQEMNLVTGNPTWDLGAKAAWGIPSSILKGLFNSDYNFSKHDLNRIMRLLPYQNLYGVNQTLNFIRDHSGLPDKGKIGLY